MRKTGASSSPKTPLGLEWATYQANKRELLRYEGQRSRSGIICGYRIQRKCWRRVGEIASSGNAALGSNRKCKSVPKNSVLYRSRLRQMTLPVAGGDLSLILSWVED